MKRQAYSTLPKLASVCCIAWSALAGCGDDDSNGTTGTTGSGSSSSTSSSAASTGGGGTDEGGGGGGGGADPGTTSSSAGGAGGGDPSGDTIRFIGRFDTTNAEGPRFSWAGSAIVTRFSGTSLGVRFNDESTAA